MKRKSMIMLIATAVFAAIQSPAFTVYMPPGNIATNSWLGNIAGYDVGVPSIPNGWDVEGSDIYQDLRTTPGQAYSLSFYAAADLYFGPSVSVDVDLNQMVAFSFTTPPYPYNPQVNRTDQMRWQQLTSPFVASSSTTRLEFIDLNTYDFGLAAVSVVPVPEPTSFTLMVIGGVTLVLIRKQRT